MQKIKIQGLILFSASLTALFQKGQKEPPVTHIGGEKQEMVKIGFSTPYMSDWVLLHTTETGLQHTNLLVREGWRYQIGWIFGKNSNSLQPPPHFQKIVSQILDLYKGIFPGPQKNWNIIFRKWGGGVVEGHLEFFPKIHPIW